MDTLKKDSAENGQKEPEREVSLWMHYTKQFLMILGASMGFSSLGMALVWPNILVSHLDKDNSTIYGTAISFNKWEIDTTSSMIFVGSLLGYLLVGWLMGYAGRKWSIFVGGIPCIVGNILVALTYNVNMLIVGRFLDGVTYGMMTVAVRAYVIEISNPKFRGGASIIVNIWMQIGGLAILGLGFVLSWYHVALFSCGTMSIYCFLIVPLLPESPTFLAVRNRDAEALSVLSQVRSPSVNLSEELNHLKKINDVGNNSKIGYRGLLRPVIMKKLAILFGLFLISNFSGVQVLKANIVRILESSGMRTENNIGAILVICVIFVGNFTMMLLVDKLGRRRCITISYSFIAVAYYSLGCYNFKDFGVTQNSIENSHFYYNETLMNTTLTVESGASTADNSWTWIPLACLMLAAFGQSIGAGPLPFVLAPEYFPTNIRSQGASLCTLVGSLQAFATLQLFSPMQDLLTNGGLYLVYAISATIGIPYVLCLIKETSGKQVG